LAAGQRRKSASQPTSARRIYVVRSVGEERGVVTKTPLLLAGLFLLMVGTYAFFALSARNEIYYLCGNFKSGVSYSSVVRQLNTANLSDYKIEKSEQGKRVTYSSALHLNLVRCEITFAEDEKVSHAIYK
jgi:hypothetical protein